jgi:hypothetical protein
VGGKSERDRLAEVFVSVGLSFGEVAAEGEGLREVARAHGVPDGVEVWRALDLASGDVLFFDRGGSYVGMGSSYGAPLFWPRGQEDPVSGASSRPALPTDRELEEIADRLGIGPRRSTTGG